MKMKNCDFKHCMSHTTDANAWSGVRLKAIYLVHNTEVVKPYMTIQNSDTFPFRG
jgi:hypothetical protein